MIWTYPIPHPQERKKKSRNPQDLEYGTRRGLMDPQAVALQHDGKGSVFIVTLRALSSESSASLFIERACIPEGQPSFSYLFIDVIWLVLVPFLGPNILQSPNINYWLGYPTTSASLGDVLSLQFLHFHVWEIYVSSMGPNVSPCAHTLSHIPLARMLVTVPGTRGYQWESQIYSWQISL